LAHRSHTLDPDVPEDEPVLVLYAHDPAARAAAQAYLANAETRCKAAGSELAAGRVADAQEFLDACAAYRFALRDQGKALPLPGEPRPRGNGGGKGEKSEGSGGALSPVGKGR
jgi:hypothetical protein